MHCILDNISHQTLTQISRAEFIIHHQRLELKTAMDTDLSGLRFKT